MRRYILNQAFKGVLVFSLVVAYGGTMLFAADPNDPFDSDAQFDIQPPTNWPIDSDPKVDDGKTADQLIDEANFLLADERLLDARTKLLRALQKEPKNYNAHLLLGGYYLVHVGHFRLALKYILRGEQLFYEKNGAPPYRDDQLKNDHARLLYLLAETRLNLDNYQGALDVLNEFGKLYFGAWYPASRAWVLMKLGKLDEAIRVARLGLLTEAEPGRTLNVLGILLSMTGKRQESLKVFNEAIMHELSMGSSGQPATPLNNSGEVYREIFNEEKAEAMWLKATSMPDGCEHVLPSMNLAIMFIEQLRLTDAKKAIDAFESCITQFPLRNGEEHRALVHLARGRIALHSGDVHSAVQHLEAARERRQWFGKIGTSINDHLSAALTSLGQALRREANVIEQRRNRTFWERITDKKKIYENRIRAWWHLRRTRQILAEDLANIEDLYVRHSDSMLEYPTFGEILAPLPYGVFAQRVEHEMKGDDRVGALAYYLAYLAENAFYYHKNETGAQFAAKALARIRTPGDLGLKLHLLMLKLAQARSDMEGATYQALTQEIFKLNRSELRNFGFPLPVIVSGSPDVRSDLSGSPFLASKGKTPFSIKASSTAQGYLLRFEGPTFSQQAEGKSIEEAIDALAELVFVQKL